MLKFKRLKKGGFIMVVKHNDSQKIVHAYSISSPRLKHSNYRVDSIDHTWDKVSELLHAFDNTDYAYVECEHITKEAFEEREKLIEIELFPLRYYQKN